MSIGFTAKLDSCNSQLYSGGLQLAGKPATLRSQSVAYQPQPMDQFRCWQIAGRRVLMERLTDSYWEMRKDFV